MSGPTQVAVFAIALLVGACDADPARSVKILERPVDLSNATEIKTSQVNWRPQYCPGPSEFKKGPSQVKITGPCTFDFNTEMLCHGEGDDFYASLRSKKQKSKGTLAVNINVESYHGPGSYDDTEMSIWIRVGTDEFRWYRWSSDRVKSVVGPDEETVTIIKSELHGEPMLTSCKKLGGASKNYKYECDGISGSPTAIESTAEIVDGTFKCVKIDKKRGG